MSSAAPKSVTISELRPTFSTTYNVEFILLEKGTPIRKGNDLVIAMALVADHTASVSLQLWGPQVDAFQPGDIIMMTNGMFVRNNESGPILKSGKMGKLERTGEFTMLFTETPNMSTIHWIQDPNGPQNSYMPVMNPTKKQKVTK